MDLVPILNEFQNVSRSQMYWSRVLHYWLINFADIAFVEWARMGECDSSNFGEISSPSLSWPRRRSRETHYMNQLLDTSQCLEWRKRLRADCLEFHQEGKIKPIYDEHNASSRQTRKHWKEVLYQGLMSTLRILPSTKVVLATPHFPKIVEFVLAARVHALPVRWMDPSVNLFQVVQGSRQRIARALKSTNERNFEDFLRAALSHYLPISIVENYSSIIEKLKTQRPGSPELIFSANLHFSSDSFAIWAAEQSERGAVLLLGQHGGLNGQGRTPTRDEELEMLLADRYCHWGWSDRPSDLRIPAQINVWARKRKKFMSKGIVLLVSDATFRFNRKIWSDADRYKTLVLETFAAIPNIARPSTLVRLHKDHERYDTSHVLMWSKHHPSASLDIGMLSIKKFYRKSKLVICTTLGTTEIECFARNIPVVLSLDSRLHEPRESFAQLVRKMERVGLLHFTRESLREFFEQNLDDLEKWWLQHEVQDVIKEYMNVFGYMPRRPVSELLRIFREFHR